MKQLLGPIRLTLTAGLLCAMGVLAARPAWGQLNREPEATKGVEIVSRLGDQLELDTRFHDDHNHYVRLGDFFDGKKPVILSFNYSNCPKLCSVQLENMTVALGQLDFTVGEDFEVVSISIDPLEQTSRAKATKDLYTKIYNRRGSEDGFHFLVADPETIRFMTDSCGFKYKYIPHQKLYSHSPVFLLISPSGKIVRYIHGLDYKPVTIERALVEAAEGKIGSPINRLSYALGCFLYDESTGQYTTQVMGIMRIGGAIMVAVLMFTLLPYWFFRRNNSNPAAVSDEPQDIITHPSTP